MSGPEDNRDRGVWPNLDLPPSWEWTPFEEIVRNVTSTDQKLKQKDYAPAGRFPVIDQGQEEIGGFSDREDLVHPGPLPVVIFGDHTRCAKYVNRRFIQGADGVKVLSPTTALLPEFLFMGLRAIQLPDKGYSRHFKFLKHSVFPVAPLDEQRRIVEKIEALTAKSRRAKDALYAIPPLLERFRQSVLAAAFRGDLTADWRAKNPDVEPAEELLARIRKERRAHWEEAELAKMRAKGKEPKNDKWKVKYKEPDPVDTAGLPDLPMGWCWVRLDALTLIKGGVTKGQKRRSDMSYRRVPYLRVANVQRGYLVLDEVTEIEAPEPVIDELRLREGDVLFTEGGDRDKLGRGWVWSGELAECIHQNHIFRARPVSREIVPTLISWYGNAYGQAFFISRGKQTTNLASINMTQLSGFPVPLPPAAEQVVLHRRISDAFVRIADFVSTFAPAAEQADLLDQAILAKAFRGELVPQDPNDEPASVLLERIRAEREKAEPKKRTKRRSKQAAT